MVALSGTARLTYRVLPSRGSDSVVPYAPIGHLYSEISGIELVIVYIYDNSCALTVLKNDNVNRLRTVINSL